jgi:hypothetical protein
MGKTRVPRQAQPELFEEPFHVDNHSIVADIQRSVAHRKPAT